MGVSLFCIHTNSSLLNESFNISIVVTAYTAASLDESAK